MTEGVIFGIVSMLAGLCGIIFGIISNKRNLRQDSVAEGQSNGAILTEIGYIKSGVDDIKHKQDQQDRRWIEINERMVKVESSARQSKERLDRLEEAHNKN